jgi:hypothetical protein
MDDRKRLRAEVEAKKQKILENFKKLKSKGSLTKKSDELTSMLGAPVTPSSQSSV